MRIEVVGEDTISQQARTYAEYRVFAALTQFSDADKVRRVRVVLRPVDRGRGCEGIACTVTVALAGSDSLRIRTTGPHAYAAINRAVERIRTTAATGIVETASPCEVPETETMRYCVVPCASPCYGWCEVIDTIPD